MTTFNSLRHLRLFLGLSQREIALLGECTRHTIESVEQGRLKLSKDLGFRISQATGAPYKWLMDDDENLPMINDQGKVYDRKDFELALGALESLRVASVEPELEVAAAYDFLCRTLDAARTRNTLAVSDFRKRLEQYVRSEIHRFPELRDEVYQEIQRWGEKNVATGKSYPKTFLFPRSTRPFQRAQKRAAAAIQAIQAIKK